MKSKNLRVVRSGRVSLVTDPVSDLAAIQGPVRHAWWSFWVSVQGGAFRLARHFGGSWSVPWVIGQVASWASRLERLTR